jgi:hypothetical protein
MLGPCNAIKKIRGLQTSTMITKDVKTTHWIQVTMKGWMEERKAKRRFLFLFLMLYEVTRAHELLAKIF